jgi:hypothetical protein
MRYTGADLEVQAWLCDIGAATALLGRLHSLFDAGMLDAEMRAWFARLNADLTALLPPLAALLGDLAGTAIDAWVICAHWSLSRLGDRVGVVGHA